MKSRKDGDCMTEIYQHPKLGLRIFTQVPLPKKKGDYLYFLRIGNKWARLHKIGTTCEMLDRMKEHLRNYHEDIYIYFISPSYSKWTTLRVEDRMKEEWKKAGWQYLRNDRFIIPEGIDQIIIKVNKDWLVNLGE